MNLLQTLAWYVHVKPLINRVKNNARKLDIYQMTGVIPDLEERGTIEWDKERLVVFLEDYHERLSYDPLVALYFPRIPMESAKRMRYLRAKSKK